MADSKSSRWRCQTVGRAMFAVVLVLSVAIPLASLAQDPSDPSADIVGTYTVVINVTDVPLDVANGPALYGRWQIIFNADGSYRTERADVTGDMVTGSYEIEGNQLTVTDEGGLLSCANASIVGSEIDAATGIYTWNRNDDRISMVPVEDNCAGRRILFSTRQMTGYIPCATQPLQLSTSASPEAVEPTEAASPVADASPVAILDAATPEPAGSPQADGTVPQAIDTLLSQMTSCWATGQPELFLPLMTSSYRAQFLQQETGTDPIAELATLMASTPFVWERAGEVDIIDATHATALVRQAINTQEDFVRYSFVFEDGAWRWNGAG
jgi:hypothetical protein